MDNSADVANEPRYQPARAPLARVAGGALADAPARWLQLFELTTDFRWEQDAQLRFVAVWGGLDRLSGITAKDVIGRTRWDIGVEPISDGGSWEAHKATLLARQRFFDFRYRRRNGCGQWRCFSTSGMPVVDDHGRFSGYVGVSRDITEQLATEQALRHTNGLLESVFETMDAGVSVFDRELRLVVVNRRFRELFDYPPELCLPGTPFSAFVRLNVERGDYGPGDPDAQVEQRVAQARRFEAHHFVRERPDGSILDITGRPLPHGGFVTLYVDVTQRVRSERALRESKLVLENTFEHMDQGISIADENLRVIGMNRRFGELLDFPAELCKPGTPFSSFIRHNAERGDYGPGDVEAQVRERVELAGRFQPHVFQRTRPDGTVIEVRGRPMPSGGFVTLYSDVTERASAERALRESEERFRSLTALSSDWFWEQDAQGRFTRLEGRHVAGGEGTFAGELGRTWGELGFEADEGWTEAARCMAQGLPFHERVMRRRLPDGTLRHVRVSGEPLRQADGTVVGYRGVGRDVTAQRQAEEQVQYLATHDALTGLPNRAWFHQLLSVELKAAQRYGRQLAVLFIDLDRFKLINDSLGHDAGDELLRQIAARLTRCLRASDVVARLGGDEFVVLLGEARTRELATVAVHKVLAAVLEPVTLGTQSCRISASVGVSMFPEDGADEQTLMKHADSAMYVAKEEGKNGFRFFAPEIEQRSAERLALEMHLREALPRGELALHYQPRVNLGTGRITGVEALLRWTHPELGAVSPARFIPIAEQSALIVSIGTWVLETACRQNVAWQQAGLPPTRISVNISPRQFAEDDLLQCIEHALARSGLAPQWLELEITEGMVMHDTERAAQVLGRIRQLGVRVSIDDFGTGYSSLAQIKRFPISTLKIDRSFVRDLAHDGADRAITEAIIAMGRALGLEVVAEGVETAEQLAFLREHRCDEMQGYLLSRPVPADDLAQLLARPVLPA
jgi:diguanylate cyclase (GGDEF)-like protein/PAS domain S-box-containing protein